MMPLNLLSYFIVFLLLGCKSQQLQLNFSSSNDTIGSMEILGQPSLINNRNITLQLNSNKATQMAIFAGDCDLKKAVWQNFESTKSFTLSGSDGLRQISVLFRDDNKFQSECISTSVTLDTQGPTQPGAIVFATTIAGKFATPKMAFTASTDATTSVASYEARLLKSPSLDEVAIWTDVSLNNINSQITGLTLAEGQDYVVEVRAKDAAGNYSDARRSSVFRAGPFLNITVSSSTLYPGIYKVRFELSSLASQLISFNYSTEEITAKTGYHFKQLSGTGNITIGKYFFDTYLEVLGYPYYDGNAGNTRSLKVNVTNITNAGANDDFKTVTVEHLATKPQMQNIKQLSLSGSTLCALSEAGNTFCGGYNNFRFSLGRPFAESDIGYISKHSDVSDAKFVTVANDGGCVISGAQNSLSCWGGSSHETGRPSGLSTVTPLSFTDVSTVGVGSYHGCFINYSGQMFCSGENSDYQQGHTGGSSTVFTYIGSGFDNVSKLELGGWSTCYIQNAKVYCFGDNDNEMLGIPSSTSKLATPTQIGSFNEVTDLSVDNYSTACLVNAGSVYCWGQNDSFILGNKVDAKNYVPQLIPLPGLVTKVSVGSSHACAIIDQTKVYCWGENSYAAFGTSNYVGDGTAPVLVYSSSETLTQVEVGSGRTCVLGASKVPKCWGSTLGYMGNLRNNTASSVHYPVYANLGLGTFKDLKGTHNLMCLLTTTSKLYCWGFNPSYPEKMSVGLVHNFAPKLMFNGNRIKEFAIGWNHVCGILESSSQVVCVGKNNRGQLGTGTTTDSMTPIAAVGVSNASKIAIAGDSTCVVLTDGAVKCWGDNSVYKNASTTNFTSDNYAVSFNSTPVTAWYGTSGLDIVGVDNTFCLLKKTKTVRCHGFLLNGEDGVPSASTNGTSGFDVEDLTNIEKVYAGSFGFCASDTAGATKCWGRNLYRRFGAMAEGSIVELASELVGASSPIDVSVGPYNTCIVDSTSGAKCMGVANKGVAGPLLGSNQSAFQSIARLEGGLSRIAIVPFSSLIDPSATGWVNYSITDISACALTYTGELVCWGTGVYNLGLGAYFDGGDIYSVIRPEVFTPFYGGD